MGDVGAHNISRSQQYCGWLARLWVRSAPSTFHGANITALGWHGYGRGQVLDISLRLHYCGRLLRLWAMSGPLTFHEASISVVGWHGCGRGRGLQHFRKPALRWLTSMIMGEVGAITFHVPNTTVIVCQGHCWQFDGDSITVFGRQGYGR